MAIKFFKIIVIGSGPGGSITAHTLAKAGLEVAVLEEGRRIELDANDAFKSQEILSKYRAGGITMAFGKPNLSYIEGKTLGGGSEINAGLFQRIPDSVLERWQHEAGLQISKEDLEPFFKEIESTLDIKVTEQANASDSAKKLEELAQKMQWRGEHIPSWFDSPLQRRSMTKTYLPMAEGYGAKLFSRHKVLKIKKGRGGKLFVLGINESGTFNYECEKVFVCAGAIQTPWLLRRSGFKTNIGNQLFAHPTVKLTAKFDSAVNAPKAQIGTFQIKEFSPQITFGCSISAPPHLALTMLDHHSHIPDMLKSYQQYSTFYCSVMGGGSGKIRLLPTANEPIVSYQINSNEYDNLKIGFSNLAMGLLSVGAKSLFPTVRGSPIISNSDDLKYYLDKKILPSKMRLVTYHLMGSCPMGEKDNVCATDSFGRLREEQNIVINDASLFCSALGVNPQGTILALALRNCLKFLDGY